MDPVAEGLRAALGRSDGLVLGGNDFLYTAELDQHPCAYLLYRYGPLLASLGVDTVFLENHYVSEPIQTRGFIGGVMYCAYRFGMRVVGLEFKGEPGEYERFTGVRPAEKVTTVAYDERNRILRLNTVTEDLVRRQRRGKYILFCGMSHVGKEHDIDGIAERLAVPGLGVQLRDRTRWTERGLFEDAASFYRRPTDFLVGMEEDRKVSDSLHVHSAIFSALHDYLFFFLAYRRLVPRATPDGLWKSVFHVYPMEYLMILRHIGETDPRLAASNETLEQIASIVYDELRATRREDRARMLAGVTPTMLDAAADALIRWMRSEAALGETTTPEQRLALMDMIFLEKKKMDTESDEETWLDDLRVKFRKQPTRPEHHLAQWLDLLLSLRRNVGADGQPALPLPSTKYLGRLRQSVTSEPER